MTTPYVKLENVRLRFCNLFTPKAPNIGGEETRPRYDATILVVKDSKNDKSLQAKMKSVMQEKLKEKAGSVYRQLEKQDRIQYRDGDDFAHKYPEYEGHMVISATRAVSQGRPEIRGMDGKPLQESDGLPYPGCWVNVWIQPYHMDAYGGRLNLGLYAIQLVKQDEAFRVGGSVPENEFEDLSMDNDEDTDKEYELPW